MSEVRACKKKVRKLVRKILMNRRFLWIAVDCENYEKAAVLRDRIQELQLELSETVKNTGGATHE